MIVRVAFGAALMLAAAGYSGTLAQSRTASDALLGRWDLVVQRGTADVAIVARGGTVRHGHSGRTIRRIRRQRAADREDRIHRRHASASPSRHSGKAIPATSRSRDGSRAIASQVR